MRRYLNKKILLCGESDGEKFKRTFNIIKRIDDGSSAVCYEAYYDSGKGILKEFYPKDAISLKRRADGQLVHEKNLDSAIEKFKEEEKEYIEPYKMLLEAKRKDNTDLETFIPYFEIYYGCDDDCNIIGTVYIWTPEAELKTFDKICDDIHKHSNVRPEHKMVKVLYSIKSLTECIRLLHGAGMIHMDIKPSNFGFVKRNNEILTQTISMFDVDSICSVYNIPKNIKTTTEYSEPEIGYEKISNQTDIYSIGAVLFNAIIITDETKKDNYIYNEKYYNRLSELVDNSKLIQASEANSHPRLRSILTKILKKCLCARPERYLNCEELLEDIEDALYYALPTEPTRKYHLGEKWILADTEKSLDKNVDRNSTSVIQYHLYNNPLYKYSGDDEKNINVLILGLGNFGQKFTDICLQTGQMINKVLNVTVISDNETDKDEIYLKYRPELSNFFNIDNALENSSDSYGNINFKVKTFSHNSKKDNEDILKNICKESTFHYVFIAMGDDELNINVAKTCLKVTKELNMPCTINFISNSKEIKKYKGITPVYINEDVKNSKLHYDIERMAFNAHIIWERDLNINYKKVKENFRKKYNHDSCVSNILSLKYKLYSVGIDMESLSFTEAAKAFYDINENNKEIINKLIYIEHRRWVTEKICLGWTSIKNIEDCIYEGTKNEKKKHHICILKSRPDQLLAKQFKSNNYKSWNTASDNEISKLDELDLMSLKLHRVYVKKAEEIKNTNLIYGSEISDIISSIENNQKLKVLFNEWFACIRDIWNGDTKKVCFYKSLKETFSDAAKELGKEKEPILKGQIEAFDKKFHPILASNEYTDYKLIDVKLIENIPFILTYTEELCMVIPYTLGNNTELFGNLAAATVVNPKSIIYISFFENSKDINEFEKSMPYIFEYMNKKQFKASVEFAIAYNNEVAIDDNFENSLKEISSRIKQVELIQIYEIKDIYNKLIEYLNHKKKNFKLITAEKNNSKISYLLQGTNFYSEFGSYKFNSINMKFTSSNCDMFNYINKSPYISVTDMFAFKLSSGQSYNHPEFYADHKSLWRKYTANRSAWKYLCNISSEYVEKNNIIAKFTKDKKKVKFKECRYIIPSMCRKKISELIDNLKKHNFIEIGSCINNFMTDSCEVVIMNIYENDSVFDKLFSNIYILMAMSEKIKFSYKKDDNKTFCVEIDNLIVNNMKISSSKYDCVIDIMHFLREKGYIINLCENSEKREISFTYATPQIKHLLTVAGNILEVYTYHKAKEIDKFDDVVSSFEIKWEKNENIKTEFDCIITKGFNTLFVECKAVNNLEPNFYYKLSELAKQFGINAKAVLVLDTDENNQNNKNNIELGKKIGVTTIYNHSEISNIGQTLKKIIEDN